MPGGATGSFRMGKIDSRWAFATPDGNAFWMLGVHAVDVSDELFRSNL
jgi:hypothetical protein